MIYISFHGYISIDDILFTFIHISFILIKHLYSDGKFKQ